MAETVLGGEEPSPSEVERAALAMSQFYEILVTIRPELGLLSQDERARIRSDLLVDQVSPAALDDHEGDTFPEHELMNALAPSWSLGA